MEVWTTEPGVQFYTDNWLMDTRDNLVPHSQDEAQSVLRHNTSQTVRIILTSPLLYSSLENYTPKKPFTNLA